MSQPSLTTESCNGAMIINSFMISHYSKTEEVASACKSSGRGVWVIYELGCNDGESQTPLIHNTYLMISCTSSKNAVTQIFITRPPLAWSARERREH